MADKGFLINDLLDEGMTLNCRSNKIVADLSFEKNQICKVETTKKRVRKTDFCIRRANGMWGTLRL